MATTPKSRDSIVIGSLWMLGITLVLFFLPVLNGLIGGLVGGYKVGGTQRALGAAVLPAIAAAIALWLLFALLDLPVIGFVAGIGVGLWVVFSSVAMLLGAAVGGALSESSTRRIEA